ncbi:hypothetical protein CR513_28087, partial [Mucuna pruriens]
MELMISLRLLKKNPTVVDALSYIPYPCSKCKNYVRKETFWVEKHLYQYGFMDDYINWIIHGEDQWGDNSSTSIVHDEKVDTRNPYVDMVIDVTGNQLNSKDQDLEEDPNPSALKFYTLLRDADEPLWDECHKHTKLSTVTQLLNLKSEFNMSESCYDRMIVIIKSMLPKSEKLQRLYMAKSTAQYMFWHANGVRHDKSMITHPTDAMAWKQFDTTYPVFAQEPRNVRFGLCTDGFNPFGGSTTPYSCWPVFVTPYNLPPRKTKDNANAREDMEMICKHPTLELKVENDKYKKPKATYVLNANKKRMVCEWIKQLKFPEWIKLLW